jgi:hypothetical protein
MSNPIYRFNHRFSPFRIVATAPSSIILPHGGIVVSYDVNKFNLSFETINMFRNAGYQERTNNPTYPHSVLVMFDQDRDPRVLHYLNTLVCCFPSLAARLNAVQESKGRVTLWLECVLEGDFEAAETVAYHAPLKDEWTVELRELEMMSEIPEDFTNRVTSRDQRDEIVLPCDSLDRSVLEVGNLYPLGWASRAARQGVRS